MKVRNLVADLRKLSDEELETKIKEAKKELFDLRLKQSTGSLEKPSKIKEDRKTIARIKQIISERENNKEA